VAPPSDGDSGSGTGHVAFFVKDAPSDDFSSVFVTFSRVEVHKAGDGNETDDNATASPSPSSNTTAPTNSTAPVNTTAPANSTAPANTTASAADDAGESGWIVIVNSTQSVDLKAFQGDAKAFLGGSDIAAGKYTQIRIFVDRAWGVANGSEVNLSLPSGTLKIVRPWTVGAGENTTLVVDFELDKSIHLTGNGKYQLKPVMKLAIEKGSDEAEAGDESETATANRGGPKSNNTKGKPQ
jgi:uncharacterized protein DUF4382